MTLNADTVWPLPMFYFQVEWDGDTLSFQEVSGLDFEAQPIEYRHGDSPAFSTINMPGITKSGRVTLKKGVFKSGSRFWDWFSRVKSDVARRKAVTISLLDESGAPTMVWTLENAWPTKVTCTDPGSDGSEAAIETLEIEHEGLTIAHGSPSE